ncbi:MAG TPA: SRPBCC family protein [Thermoleophilaceae bacterium]|jgi:carbon monoxide dehydrogenase subunit G|nr:SRPBCC family protein [Thermoleophilaceae bacterium]
MKAAAEVVVERPLEAVWLWASDPRNWENWLDGVSDVRLRGRLEQGARLTSRYRYAGRTHDIEYEIVERTPARRQVVRSISGPFPFEGVLELAEEAAGTRVRQTVHAGSDSALTSVILALGGPLLRRGMNRRIGTQLERLKAGIELTGAN